MSTGSATLRARNENEARTREEQRSYYWTDPGTLERWKVNTDGVWRWAGGAWRCSGWRSAVSDQLLRLASSTTLR